MAVAAQRQKLRQSLLVHGQRRTYSSSNSSKEPGIEPSASSAPQKLPKPGGQGNQEALTVTWSPKADMNSSRTVRLGSTSNSCAQQMVAAQAIRPAAPQTIYNTAVPRCALAQPQHSPGPVPTCVRYAIFMFSLALITSPLSGVSLPMMICTKEAQDRTSRWHG